jgi:chitodextrinase
VATARSKSKKALIQDRSSFKPYQLVGAVAVLVVAGAFFIARGHAASGTLTLQPSSSTVGVGNNFTVTVHENSGSDAVNAVEADLTYPANSLQFVSIDATTSAFGVQAVSTGGNGTITLARGTQTAVTGDQIVAVVTFKALTVTGASSAAVAFANSSAIVRSSDQTNVLVGTTPGSYTISDQTAPSVPTGVTAGTRTMTSIPITWTASTDNIGVTGYKVYRNGTQVGSPATTSYTDNNLTPGTNYSYTVAAFDAAGNVSGQSTALATSTLPDTQAPTVPGTPTSPAQTMSSISLSWAASTDNVAVTGYKVYRNGTQITTSASTSYTDTNLTPNTIYSYTVAAYDAAGNTSVQSAAGSLRTLPDTQAPTAPGTPAVSQTTQQNVSLTYNAATDNLAVTGYNIYRDNVKITTTTSLSYTDSNVSTGNHVYAVSAVDAAGNESTKSSASVYVYATADINRDGSVNIFDLSTMLSNWGHTWASSSDMNGDSVVNIFDLSALLAAWTG